MYSININIKTPIFAFSLTRHFQFIALVYDSGNYYGIVKEELGTNALFCFQISFKIYTLV